MFTKNHSTIGPHAHHRTIKFKDDEVVLHAPASLPSFLPPPTCSSGAPPLPASLTFPPGRVPVYLPACMTDCIPAWSPTYLLAWLPTCLPDRVPACLLTCLPTSSPPCVPLREQHRRPGPSASQDAQVGEEEGDGAAPLVATEGVKSLAVGIAPHAVLVDALVYRALNRVQRAESKPKSSSMVRSGPSCPV